jgi:sugar phosphate isomerase/epimerase
MSPRLYLAVDNCFASKRWTAPHDWMRLAREAGITRIEASADNECDPLYSTPEALAAWIEAVRAGTEHTGVRVVNFYSGHGTYTTLGLAHTDPRIADHIQHDWLYHMIDVAAGLGAGLGFYTHAFAQSTLRDPALYSRGYDYLLRRLAELATYAQAAGLPQLSLEQMYAPHQIPWTIEGARALLAEVYARAGAPLYLTLDTGHHVGQRRFLKPERGAVEAYIRARREGVKAPAEPWLGTAEMYDYITARDEQPLDLLVDEVMGYIEARPYLFASEVDGDVYAWLRSLGAYSPILHLQQTDGTASAHRPFTAQHNASGQIEPRRVFEALAEAYAQPEDSTMPPRCGEITLTFEFFPGTAERPNHTLANLHESAAYWRAFLPRDGMTLDEVLAG